MSQTVYVVRLRRAFASYYDPDSGIIQKVGKANAGVFASLEAAKWFAASAAPEHSPFQVDAIDWFDDESGFEVHLSNDETDWEFYLKPDGEFSGNEDPENEEDFDERNVPESDVIESVRNAGLPARTTGDWHDWWLAHAPTMSDAQRAAIWRVFIETPYLIVAIPAEL